MDLPRFFLGFDLVPGLVGVVAAVEAAAIEVAIEVVAIEQALHLYQLATV